MKTDDSLRVECYRPTVLKLTGAVLSKVQSAPPAMAAPIFLGGIAAYLTVALMPVRLREVLIFRERNEWTRQFSKHLLGRFHYDVGVTE